MQSYRGTFIALLIISSLVGGGNCWPPGSVDSCPPGDPPTCPHNPANDFDNLFNHPSDCHYYVHCDAGAQPLCVECSANLHFSPTLHICDWPANAGCEGALPSPTTTTTATTTTTTTQPPTTTTTEPTTTTTEPTTTTTEPTTTTTEPTTTTTEPTTTTTEPTTTTTEPTTTTTEPTTTTTEPTTTTTEPTTTTTEPTTTTTTEPTTTTTEPTTTTTLPPTTTTTQPPTTTTTLPPTTTTKAPPPTNMPPPIFGECGGRTTTPTCEECPPDCTIDCPVCTCSDEKLAHPFYCDWYYQCEDFVVTAKKCDSGWLFDGESKACVCPECEARCSIQACPDPCL